MYNFKLVNADTDSIMVCKPDQSEFTSEEQERLLEELNSIFPETINWEQEGDLIKKVVVFKAKNYILYDGKKIKYKGSSLKSSTLESGLKEFIDESVKCLLEDRQEDFTNVYNKYVKILHNIQTKEEMKKWCSKKTLTEKVYDSDRLNETKILQAIQGAEYSHGDKIWVYFDNLDNLVLIENFKPNDYNVSKLLEKLYKCVLRFCDVVDTSQCLNYKLKRNKKLLEELIK